MSLAERGLLFTLRLEFWANGSVPGDIRELAAVLGIPESVLSDAMTDRVRGFMEAGVAGDLCFPDLEDYRKSLASRREAMAKGAEKTNRIRRSKKPPAEASTPVAEDGPVNVSHDATRDVPRPAPHDAGHDATRETTLDARRTPLRGEESKRKERSGSASFKGGAPTDHHEWLDDYQQAETAEAYRKASRAG
jgi:hypothetical protein